MITVSAAIARWFALKPAPGPGSAQRACYRGPAKRRNPDETVQLGIDAHFHLIDGLANETVLSLQKKR
jgi:hypothetical protein